MTHMVQSLFIQNSLYNKYKDRKFIVNSQEETEDFINRIIYYTDIDDTNNSILSIIINKYVSTYLCMRALSQCIRYTYDYDTIYNENLETIEGIQQDSFEIKLNCDTSIIIIKTQTYMFTIKYISRNNALYFYNISPKKIFSKLDQIIYGN